MKLLYILHKFLPRYFSGTEIYTFSLAKEMQRRGHEVLVFCAENVEGGPDCRIWATEDIYEGIPVHRINFNRKKTPDVVRYAYANPLVAEHLAGFMFEHMPELVHITSFINVSAAVVDVVKSFSLPALFTSTDYWCFCPRSILLDFDLELCAKAEAKKCLACIVNLSSLHNRVFKKAGFSQELTAGLLSLVSRVPGLRSNSFLRAREALEQRPLYLREKLEKLDLIIAPNAFMRQLYLEAGLPEEKVIISGYGLNKAGLEQGEREDAPGPLRLAYIGMLGQLKGVDVLIRAFIESAPTGRATLAIYGDSSHFPDYCRRLRELAEDNHAVSFKGTFPPDRLGEVLGSIDVLVVPSLWYENAPLVIQSAFAARVPVVAADVPGIAELVKDDVNGLLFPRGNKEALIGCLNRVLDDADLVPRLRENISPIKTISENGDELEAIYAGLTDSRGGGFQGRTGTSEISNPTCKIFSSVFGGNVQG